MQCQDEQIGPMLRVCKVCGLPARTDRPIKRECKGPPPVEPEPPKAGKPRLPRVPAESPYDRPVCAKRGELLREQECKPCQASGQLAIAEVYACSVHGECTLRNTSIQPRIRGCVTCLQYERPPVDITT